MRKALLILGIAVFAAVFPVTGLCARETQPDDSLLLKRLDYILLSLEEESVTVQGEMCDFFIESCEDSAVRSDVALHLYKHYLEAPQMGVEAVAIHIFDTWYSDGKVKFPDEEDFFLARLYAATNRGTLIGSEAPLLTLKDCNGDPVCVTAPSSRLKVLLFYDIDCSRCRIFTTMLDEMLASDDPDIEFYAIYTGRDTLGWDAWRGKHFLTSKNSRSSIWNLWDPESESGFALSYGVMQTPKMFLLDGTGTVIGRALTPQALEYMLGLPLTRLSPVGSALPDIEVTGKMLRRRFGKVREKTLKMSLSDLRNSVLFFYDEDCSSCREHIAHIPEYLSRNRGTKIFMVEAGPEFVTHFDLSVLPLLLRIDRRGLVGEKYLSIFEGGIL
ncbi:MAG: thioredoxin family protein [Bacteroidales bacterium]|nr:thioredoxin family protein [Bacteroidales bacterium]